MPRRSKRILNDFKKMSAQDIKKLNRSQAHNLLRQVRYEAIKQSEKIYNATKRSDKFYSPAEKNLRDWYEERYLTQSDFSKENYIPPVSKMKIADTKAELETLQKFFNAKTSSVTGAQKVAKARDMRIFGPSESDPKQPARRMTRDEAEKFWAAYNEFKNSMIGGDLYWRKYSQVQTELGNIVVNKRKNRKNLDVYELINDLRNKLAEGEDDYEYSDLSEFSGSGDDFGY